MDNPFGQISLKKRQIAFVVLIAALMCFLGSVVNFGSDSSSAEEPTVDYQHFYRDRLTDTEKRIYNGFDSMDIEDPTFKITLQNTDGKSPTEFSEQVKEDIGNVLDIYKSENLYKYWVGNEVSINYSSSDYVSYEVTVTLTEKMTKYGATVAEVDANVTKIKDVINSFSDGIDKSSTFTKVQSIHAIVAGLLEYGDATDPTVVPRNIATAFLSGSFDDPAQVVCEGYAKAFKAICDEYDVPCIIVSGKAGTTGDSEEYENHMWNQVKMDDGKWYLVDCTWDDQSTGILTELMLVGSDTELTSFFDEPPVKTVKECYLKDPIYDRSTFSILLTDTAFAYPEYKITLNSDSKAMAILYYNSGDSIVVPYTPVKTATLYEKYTFKEWSIDGKSVRELPTVTGDEKDLSYDAEFTSTKIMYHIIFKDKYGKTYLEKDYPAGDTVKAPTASKDPDNYASYTFNYWSIDGETQVEVKTEALEDVTYIAVYEETLFHYTVTFKDYDDSQISTKSDYIYGASILAPADPEREKTNTQVFTFKCWNTSPAGDGSQYKDVVEGNITYYAIYTAEDRYYTVILKGADGAVIGESKYLYESTLVLPDSLVDAEWKTELPEKVTADATYVAKVSTVISPAGTVVLTSDSNTAAVSLKVISEMKSHSGGTFNLSTGTVTFDAEAVKSLLADQTIQVNKKSFSALSDSARSQLGNAEVYEITFGANDSVFSAGSATVTIPYKLASGQSASDVKLFHVDGDNLSSVECRYYDGNVTFSTGHFSYYAIQIPDNSSSIVNLIKDNVVIIAILIFAIIGIALSYKFSKP